MILRRVDHFVKSLPMQVMSLQLSSTLLKMAKVTSVITLQLANMATCLKWVSLTLQKVTRSLEHAASVAALMLTTECMITDLPEDKPAIPDMGGMGGMGGMM